jgi:hypothetical protein
MNEFRDVASIIDYDSEKFGVMEEIFVLILTLDSFLDSHLDVMLNWKSNSRTSLVMN